MATFHLHSWIQFFCPIHSYTDVGVQAEWGGILPQIGHPTPFPGNRLKEFDITTCYEMR